MDINDIPYRQQTLLAFMGLRLHGTDANLVGPPPSDEDLAALYDGQLEATRRAQVIAHIAHSEEHYARWMRCFEANRYIASLEASPLAETHAETASNRGFWANLNEMFTRSRWQLAGGIVATIALGFALSLQLRNADYIADIDGLYAATGSEFDQRWSTASHRPHRAALSMRSFFIKPKSDAEQAMESGFATGIAQLGAEKFSALALNVDKIKGATATDAAADSDLFQLGRLAAAATLHCAADQNAPTLADLPKSLDTLMQQAVSQDEAFLRIKKTWEGPSSGTAGVCRTVEAITMNVFR